MRSAVQARLSLLRLHEYLCSVKPLRADGTAAMWESRSVPDLGSPAGSKPRGFFLFVPGRAVPDFCSFV